MTARRASTQIPPRNRYGVRSAVLWAALFLIGGSRIALAAVGEISRQALDKTGRFGPVTVLVPAGKPTAIVLYLSGDGGLDASTRARGQLLAEHGAVVAETEYRPYVGHYRAASGNPCIWPSIDFQTLAKRVELAASLPRYVPPVLVGEGESGSLALVSVAQGPPGSFAGVVTVGLCPLLETRDPPCSACGHAFFQGGPGNEVGRLRPPLNLTAPWVAIEAGGLGACPSEAADELIASAPSATRVSLEPTTAGTDSRVSEALIDAVSRLEVTTTASVPGGAALDLPLIELPAAGTRDDTLAVFVSGDGGWAVLDQLVSEALAANGVSVVGWNAGRYLWQPTTRVEQATQDLERITRHYLEAWRKQRLVLAGYSTGADLVATVARRLPPDLLERVRAVALIGPSEGNTLLRPGGEDRDRGASPEGVDTLSEILPLAGRRILCIQGSEEPSSLCPKLPPGFATILDLRAGHGFKGDQPAIGRAILDFLQ